jgi:hypothetical protein
MRIKAFLFLGITMITAACSHIDESEQLVYVPLEPAKRIVLLEDFTGQRCVNCPRGTEIIRQLHDTYGDTVVAVGIYSGPFGKAVNGRLLPLTTAVGDAYFDHWKLEAQPVGMVNRRKAINYPEWPTAVKEELTKSSPLSLQLSGQLTDGKIAINVTSSGTTGTVVGKLQVWVVEDSIVAVQTRHDPIDNDNVTINDASYVHNHVFRAAVNGTWGDDFIIHEGEQNTQSMTIDVDPAWTPAHLSIVAFVYNDNGVEQAVKSHLLIK